MKLLKLFCLNLILAVALTANAKTPEKRSHKRHLESVNEHMMRTNKKIQLEKSRTEVDNSLSAPEMEKAASFENQSEYSSYGVDMKQEQKIHDPSQRKSYQPRSSDALMEEQMLEEQNR